MTATLPPGFTLTEGVPDERYPDWLDCWLGAFGTPPGADPDMVAFYRGTHPPERCLVISDDGGYVATNTSVHRDLVLPGGATVPLAACTGGSCHPTLTRRGLMRVTLERLHRRAHEEGKALAAGGVSEWPIYRRFGYGPATWYDSVEIDVRRAGLRPDTPGEGLRPRRVGGKEARDIAERVYRRVAAGTPGEIIPPSCFWDRLDTDPVSPELEMMLALGGPGGPRHCAAIGERGFVSYRISPDWTDEQAPNSVLQVIDFLAADAEAAGALWRHLFAVDMIHEIHMWRLPVDDPVRWWAADARHIRAVRKDGMWLRLLDVPRLLSARSWSGDGVLTLRVHDAEGYAQGTYRLEAAAGRGACERSDAEPDLELDVATLGAILLGGTPASGMYRSGRIQAADPAHVLAWDALATPGRAPFVSYWF